MELGMPLIEEPPPSPPRSPLDRLVVDLRMQTTDEDSSSDYEDDGGEFPEPPLVSFADVAAATNATPADAADDETNVTADDETAGDSGKTAEIEVLVPLECGHASVQKCE